MRQPLVLVAPIALAGFAAAQCPDWSSQFGPGGAGTTGQILSLAVFDDGHGAQLYAAGYFSTIGGVAANAIARFDGQGWHPLDAAHEPVNEVFALAVFDDGLGTALFAVGDHSIAGLPGVRYVTRWDGTSWTGTGVTGGRTLGAVYDPGTGPRLYVLSEGGLGVQSLESYDAIHGWTFVLDTFLGQGLSHAVGDIGAGSRLYVAESGDRVRSFDGTSVTPLSSFPTNARVRAVAVFDDGSGAALYAGGELTSGASRGFVSRYTGSGWSDVGGTVLATESPRGIQALAVHDFGGGPRLVAAGGFTSIDGVAANNIASWDGSTWSPLGSGLGSTTGGSTPVASFDAGDGAGPALFVAGTFTQAGGVPSSHIASYRGCGGPTTSFCFGDGSAAACPCGNASAVGDQVGCLNSLGMGGSLRVNGQASIAHDTLELVGAQMPNSSALYFQGANLASGGQGFAFGDGIKCVAGPFVRLFTKSNVNGASSYPEAGDLPISVKAAITAAGTRHYQIHYRNSADFCTPATFNNSNAVSVSWAL